MFKSKTEYRPLCLNCNHMCKLKTLIKDNSKKYGEISTDEYCEYFDKIVNITNYCEKCNGFKEGKEERIKKIFNDEFQKYNDYKESGANINLIDNKAS